MCHINRYIFDINRKKTDPKMNLSGTPDYI